MPPVGVYSPKYDIVLNQLAKGFVKFDGQSMRYKKDPFYSILSPQTQSKNTLKAEEHKRSISQAPKIELPSIANMRNNKRNGLAEIENTLPIPDIL